MQKSILTVVLLLTLLSISPPVAAHFGMIIPSDSMVMPTDKRTIQLQLSFSHPFENIGMELVPPNTFAVITNDRQLDLRSSLKAHTVMGQRAWKANYKLNRPGTYVFYMEPQPYWEPAEDCFIVHHTKTVVTAFGDDEGWDRELGLKTEIVPLAKPFGLYVGNVFQGIVKMDDKPMPYTTVEVEYYNQDRKAVAPTDYMVAQTIKTDGNGVFTYAVPSGGWWGFAALNTADYKLKHNGKEKDVELGAVIWVKFHRWRQE